MNFENQIDELVTKRDETAGKVDALKQRQTALKSDNGRLRRMYNAIIENEIIYSDDQGSETLKVSNFLNEIVSYKEYNIATIQDIIDTLNVDIKKYNKAIDTLNALTEAITLAV